MGLGHQPPLLLPQLCSALTEAITSASIPRRFRQDYDRVFTKSNKFRRDGISSGIARCIHQEGHGYWRAGEKETRLNGLFGNFVGAV